MDVSNNPGYLPLDISTGFYFCLPCGFLLSYDSKLAIFLPGPCQSHISARINHTSHQASSAVNSNPLPSVYWPGLSQTLPGGLSDHRWLTESHSGRLWQNFLYTFCNRAQKHKPGGQPLTFEGSQNSLRALPLRTRGQQLPSQKPSGEPGRQRCWQSAG